MVLMIAGALPLVAEESRTIQTLQAHPTVTIVGDENHEERISIVATTSGEASEDENFKHRIPQHLIKKDLENEDEDDEEYTTTQTASEAIHDETFRLPLLLQGNEKSSYHYGDGHDVTPPIDDARISGETSDTDTTTASGSGSGSRTGFSSSSDEKTITNEGVATDSQDNHNHEKQEGINESSLLEHDQHDATIDSTTQELRQVDLDSNDHTLHTDKTDTVVVMSSVQSVDDVAELPVDAQESENSLAVGGERPDQMSRDDDDDEDSVSRVSVDYASKSAGALIIEKSKDFKGTSNLLNSDRDRYAIAPCEDKKFVVMSLSEDILVKQIKLANYERFSSSVKDFQVLGSQTLGKWFDLGTFTAKAGNGEQTFDLPEPAWVRYLKFKFLSHHGVEYYCTYSQIQVHGSTMVQGFHEQWEETETNEDGDLAINDVDGVSIYDLNPMNATSTGAHDTLGVEDHKPNNTATADTIGDSSQRPPVCSLPLSTELDSKLCGNQALSDEELFASLYDLIPSTLSTLPKASRNSLGRRTTGGELKAIRSGPAVQTMNLLPRSTPASTKPTSAAPSDTIVAPRMTDSLAGSLVHYLGTELGLLTPSLSHSSDVVDDMVEHTGVKGPRLGTNDTDSKEVEASTTVGLGQETRKGDISATDVAAQRLGEDVRDAPAVDEGAIETHQDTNQESSHSSSLDQGLVKMLENLPSAECLSKLDFAQFKVKANASRKAHGGSGTSASSSSTPMEPIFKRLTDEIKSLQASLLVHDQFTKASVACYQRIMTDLMVETDRLRTDHEERLLKLEKEVMSSRGPHMWKMARSCFRFLWTILTVVYTAIVHICKTFCAWLASVSQGSMHIPGRPYRRLLSAWPIVKAYLLRNHDGSISDVGKYLRPFTAKVDLLVERLEHTDTTSAPEVAQLASKDGEEIWRFPMVPVVLLVLLGRLWMCCFGQPGKKLKLPSNSELRAWQACAGSPTTTKHLKIDGWHGTPQVYSLDSQPHVGPPPLVSAPSIDSPQSRNAIQLPVKPVVSPMSAPPSTNAISQLDAIQI
jgi:Sad1 / UNC-like C-terminal